MALPKPIQHQDPHEILDVVLAKGDLSKLTAEERNSYYLKVCETVGLNPLTRPLEYIQLNGRLVLYAKREATDQLRAIHKVSVQDQKETELSGVYIVTVMVKDASGRTDMGKGAVNIASLKGEALANAIMKAETKAKRRATLSICGLGLLDETEILNADGDAVPSDPITEEQFKELVGLCAKAKRTGAALAKRMGFTDLHDLPAASFKEAKYIVESFIGAGPSENL